MNYYDYQPHISTGDWVETANQSVVGKKIRDITGYDVNHTALVIKFSEYEGDTPRRWIIEALGDGLELNLLSDLIKDNEFGYWYPLRYKYEHLRPLIGRVMVNEYSANRGHKKKYDLWDMIKNAWKRVRIDPGAWYCTEWAQWVMGESGVISPEQRKVAWVPGEVEKKEFTKCKIKLTINQGD